AGLGVGDRPGPQRLRRAAPPDRGVDPPADPLGSPAGGVPLPPTRALAAELGLARGVVVEAYAQLVAEGYLTSRSGGGHAAGARAGRRAEARPPPGSAARPGAPAPPAVGSRSGRPT